MAHVHRSGPLGTAALVLLAVLSLPAAGFETWPGRLPVPGNPAAARPGGTASTALGGAGPSLRSAPRFPIIGAGTPWHRPPNWNATRPAPTLRAPGAAAVEAATAAPRPARAPLPKVRATALVVPAKARDAKAPAAAAERHAAEMPGKDAAASRAAPERAARPQGARPGIGAGAKSAAQPASAASPPAQHGAENAGREKEETTAR